MHLTKASRIGLYALVEMAQHPDQRVSASSVASQFGVSENHTAKVLQQLSRSGLTQSVRGVGGGYELSKPAAEITMADVVGCIEGPFVTDDCAECPFRKESGECATDVPTCNVHSLLTELSMHVHYTLASVTIATLAQGRRAHAS